MDNLLTSENRVPLELPLSNITYSSGLTPVSGSSKSLQSKRQKQKIQRVKGGKVLHRSRNSESVRRRNERERNRIRKVNDAFDILRDYVPSCTPTNSIRRKVSKVSFILLFILYALKPYYKIVTIFFLSSFKFCGKKTTIL